MPGSSSTTRTFCIGRHCRSGPWPRQAFAPFLHKLPRRLHAAAAGAAPARPMLAGMLRRPSTSVSITPSAGLLTADPLRRLGSTWTGATPGSFASKPLCDLDLAPLPRRRSKTLRRIAVFLLFVALLVVLPAALMRVVA
jgi:hypothetical protein